MASGAARALKVEEESPPAYRIAGMVAGVTGVFRDGSR
jgi:hypothetical protein